MKINKDDICDIDIAGLNFSAKEKAVIKEFLSLPGIPYKTVAANLNLSLSALEYHVRNLMNKTGCKTKEELILFLNKNNSSSSFEGRGLTNNLYVWIGAALIVLAAIIVLVLATLQRNHNARIMAPLPSFQENFLERTAIVSKVEKLLNEQQGLKIIAIVGEGGAGKTFIGRKILSRYNADILWEINAETIDSAYNSFLDLADRIVTNSADISELERINHLQDFNQKRKKLMNFIAKLLRKSKWCLLFDNVDAIEDIRPYIPQNNENFGNGCIIITTRDKGISDVDFIKSSNVINIDYLSLKEQQKLFCNILYQKQFFELDKNTQKKVCEFLQNIPAMPLDIVAAAYYLKNTKIAFEDYEKIMRDSRHDVKKMQERLLEKNVNYNRTRYGIVSSVFEEILKEKPNSQTLLLTLCLLDSQNIPKKLLRIIAESGRSDEFLYDLRRHSMIIDGGDYISIHRSTQSIGLDYILSVLSIADRNKIINQLCSTLTPYENLDKNFMALNKLVPHLYAFLTKIKKISDSNLKKYEVALLVTIGDIYHHKMYRLQNALACFEEAIRIGENHLDKISLGKIFLKTGEVCTLMGKNDEAPHYLDKSITLLNEELFLEYAKTHRLSGVLCMRKEDFRGANKHFEKALNILNKHSSDGDIEIQLLKADTYSDMAFNYFMNGINRNEAKAALKIIQEAIDTVSKINFADNVPLKLRIVGRLAVYKSRLAGVNNALGKYDLALEIADTTEKMINDLGIENDNIVYARGVIARERGLANLRLNNVSTAYNFFLEAKDIFSKSCVDDYLFRLKMHEIECLVRLNRLNEALSVCNEMFSVYNRERNNYCNLFFNTCYYHAAVIFYRKGEKAASLRYFGKFFESMKTLCKNILEPQKYNELCRAKAFKRGDEKECFYNSLLVFEAIYWKDYEFTKYYVEENLKLVP